jgi:hypothetical protein
MTTTQAPRTGIATTHAPRTGIAHGDDDGLELEWWRTAESGHGCLDPRRSLLGIGSVGAGRTCLTRLLARRLLDDGGQVMAVDRGTGEYITAPGPTRRAVVVDPMGGTTLDPLRLFTGQEALDYASAVFAMLAGLSDVGWYSRTTTALAEGLRDAVAHGARSLVEATQALEASDNPDTARVGAQVGALLGSGLLPFLGDGEAPDLDADYVCVWLEPSWPGQPLRDEVLGYLAVALGRSAAAADAHRPAALALDGQPMSAPTAEVVVRGPREGRARNASTWLLSPRLDALPPRLVEAFSGLGANRVVLRSSSDEWPDLARFVGLDRWLAEELARAGRPGSGAHDAELRGAMHDLEEAGGRALWVDRHRRVGLVELPDAGIVPSQGFSVAGVLRDRP